MREPAVYIMSNQKNGTLYTGVTSDLIKCVYELNPNIPHTSCCERKQSVNTAAKPKNALSHRTTMLCRRFVSLSLVFTAFCRARNESLWDIRVNTV